MPGFSDYLVQLLGSDPAMTEIPPEQGQTILKGAGRAVMSAPNKAQAILQQGDLLPSQMDIDIGNPTIGMFPGPTGVAGAPADALGATAARLRRARPYNPQNVTENWLREAGVPFTTKTTPGGTSYIKFNSPYEKPEVSQALGLPKSEARFAPDEHAGIPGLGTYYGARADTATMPNKAQTALPPSAVNAQGDLYGQNKKALINFLKWRTSTSPNYDPNWLISPGTQPAATVAERPYVYRMPGGPTPIEPPQPSDSRQLDLFKKALVGGLGLGLGAAGSNKAQASIPPEIIKENKRQDELNRQLFIQRFNDQMNEEYEEKKQHYGP